MGYKLEDLIEIKHGYAFKGKDFSDEPTQKVLVTPGNIMIGGGFNPEREKYYSEDVYYPDEYDLQINDLIVSMTDLSKNGDTLGFPGLVPEVKGKKYLHNQRIGKVSILSPEIIDKEYLYCLFKTREYRHHVLSTASGSTVRHTSPSKILSYVVHLPSIKVQKKIATILLAFDEKIANNNKIIANLEQLAQTLFKRWFVDFEFPNENGEPYKSSGGEMVESELGMVPKGWEVTPLYEIADYINGTSFKVKDLGSEGLPVVKIAELKNGVTKQTRFYSKNDKDAKYLINNKDILFSWSGNPETSIDTFIWYRNKGLLNQHIFKVIANNPFSKSFVYVLLKYMKPEFTNIASDKQTTGLGHVTKADLKRLKVPKPNVDILYQFETLLKPIIESVYIYSRESISLSENRDTLLPKLLSGEITLSETENEVLEK